MKYIFTLLLLWILSLGSLVGQEYPDRHNTTLENSWISCTMSSNPNPERGNSHWIMYDFGTTYALNKSTFWNVNAYGHLDDGINDIQIDYSLDGITWNNWGRYAVEKSSGLSTYEGVEGPNFGGMVARYFLITATSNHGGSCYGLSEFRVESTAVTVSNNDNLELDIDVKASPNPFTERCVITLSESLEGNPMYQISDMSGRVVRQNSFMGQTIDIDAMGLTGGIYNVKIQNDRGIKTIQINLIK